MRKLLQGSVAILAVAGAVPALAADLSTPVYKAAPIVAPILYSWTGFYVGGNAGYSWGRGSTDLTETVITRADVTRTTLAGTPIASTTVISPPVVTSASDRARINGGLGGLQAGYNWQTDRFVWGIEGDAQITGERGGVSFCFAGPVGCAAVGTANYSLPWFATLRGRAGVAFDRVLFYATGGLAAGEIRSSFTDGVAAGFFPGGVATLDSRTTRVGWVVGAGVEGAIANNWTIKVEYLHMDLGSVDASVNGSSTSATSITVGDFRINTLLATQFNSTYRARITDDIVRIGLNYRFSWAAVSPAVVTKY